MRKILLVLIFLAFCPFLVAQQQLNNDAVIKLAKAGLTDDLIVSTINSQAGTYDTSTDGIIALKTAGVSDKVVAAVVAKASAPAPVAAVLAAAAAPAEADPNDPTSPHEPGLYLMLNSPDGKHNMVLLERTASTNERVAMGFFSRPIKAKIPGLRAPLRTSEPKPIIYMYFPAGSGFSHTGSPSQFALLILDSKKDHRETEIGRLKPVGNNALVAVMGFDQSKIVKTTPEKVGPNTFKVTPDADLPPGEYSFIAAAELSESEPATIFDFGVDAK
jgi:hypothetical protein